MRRIAESCHDGLSHKRGHAGQELGTLGSVPEFPPLWASYIKLSISFTA
jgi:hypothetical protein